MVEPYAVLNRKVVGLRNCLCGLVRHRQPNVISAEVWVRIPFGHLQLKEAERLGQQIRPPHRTRWKCPCALPAAAEGLRRWIRKATATSSSRGGHHPPARGGGGCIEWVQAGLRRRRDRSFHSRRGSAPHTTCMHTRRALHRISHPISLNSYLFLQLRGWPREIEPDNPA